jgi:glyoxylase-like metal-dependent hydrolase (beta-lactamase superfamily II)
MDLDWTKLGSSPAPDEIEVTVLGPGHGESVVVHVGGSEWIVVDSCKDKGKEPCAPLRYLQGIGVDATRAVKLIVATHWDEDHVKGIDELVSTCLASDFAAQKPL